MDNALKKHVYVTSSMLVSLSYCYYISTRIPKGLIRLISILPILFHFTILPFYLPRISISVMSFSAIVCMANGKLILLAFGKGPLSQPKTLLNFIISGALPIRNPSSKVPSNFTRKPRAFAIKCSAYAILIAVIAQYGQDMHPKLLLACLSFFVVLFMDINSTCLEFLCRILFGVEIEIVFDEPYLSTSLHNFWGWRWNLMVSNTLGQVVYKPVRYASVVLFGDDFASATACLATFLVSGIFHDLMLYCLTRVRPSWEMTAFFVVHGICVVLESRLKKALRGRLNLPRPVSVLLTLGFVALTAAWLFVTSMVSSSVDVLIITELRSIAQLWQKGIKYVNSWM